MTVISDAIVYTGAEGVPITLIFQDGEGVAVNISPANGTVAVHMRRPRGQAEVTYEDADVTIDDGPGGECTVITRANELDAEGVYKVQGWFTRTSPAGLFPSEPLQFTARRSPTAEPTP